MSVFKQLQSRKKTKKMFTPLQHDHALDLYEALEALLTAVESEQLAATALAAKRANELLAQLKKDHGLDDDEDA
jgi:hypothetical protein